MPNEAKGSEALVGPCQKLVIAPCDTERPQGERLHGRARLGQLRRFTLDLIVPSERDEGVEPRSEDPRPPDERTLDRQLDEGLDRDAVVALERDPELRATQVRLVPLAREAQPVPFELRRAGVVPQAEVVKAAEEQIARVADAWRREVRLDCSQCAVSLRGELSPVPQSVRGSSSRETA